MKIEIITDRNPFFDGKACEMGQVIDCNEQDAKSMISNGFAIEIKAPKKAAKKK